jgi:hypothetical protein
LLYTLHCGYGFEVLVMSLQASSSSSSFANVVNWYKLGPLKIKKKIEKISCHLVIKEN